MSSDDLSKLWIEEQLAWSSGKRLKAWQLNEGLRKVHFKQGVNHVLFCVENGNNITEFTLVISFQPLLFSPGPLDKYENRTMFILAGADVSVS